MDWARISINDWSNISIDNWIILPLYDDSAGGIPDIVYHDLYIRSNFNPNLYTKLSLEDVKYITRTHSYGVYTNIGVVSNGLFGWYGLSEDQFDTMTANDWNVLCAQSGLQYFNLYNKNLYIKVNKLVNYER